MNSVASTPLSPNSGDPFDGFFETLIGFEGGYVNNPADPGGETKYGISKRSYPQVDIANLTLDQAKAIYRRDFWDRIVARAIAPALSYHVFDGAVHSGIGNSIRWLQLAAGVLADGVVGEITLRAIQAQNPQALIARYLGYRLKFMTQLSTWPTFGKGWAARIAEQLKNTP